MIRLAFLARRPEPGQQATGGGAQLLKLGWRYVGSERRFNSLCQSDDDRLPPERQKSVEGKTCASRVAVCDECDQPLNERGAVDQPGRRSRADRSCREPADALVGFIRIRTRQWNFSRYRDEESFDVAQRDRSALGH